MFAREANGMFVPCFLALPLG
ncbi:hypothetical protein CBM2623_B170180 [Cupriavidus taiwanensis]|nr:hypothetical protein CBM2608_B140251 [Cupriavidus taiwanensis]SPA33108.1 hypothetical protein CBM2623_B170180 [Cupriavidus taiwanensis]